MLVLKILKDLLYCNEHAVAMFYSDDRDKILIYPSKSLLSVIVNQLIYYDLN